MRIFKSILLGGMLLLSSSAALAQVSLSQNSSGSNVFSLVGKKDKACVYYDAKDFEVVKTTAGLFANDVKEVSGQLLGVATTKEAPQKNCIIIGTLGYNEWIDQMIAKKKLDVEPLKNRWESYLVQLVRNPLPGVDKALVIVGSDRRGTAYGLLSVSRTIGVSPWYWWADAPIIKKDQLHLRVDKYISKEPTVKYRGIFINDEDWGLYRWSRDNFEKELGNFGPRTYAKVCELLLRLQANYLCPAMHDASMAFHRIPENRVVADRFAILMGASHCEPLLFNTASEWKRDKMGEWDYINNKKGVDSVLNVRVKECAPFENVYTLALRGLHDRAMNASNDMGDRKDMLQEALMAQRQMLIDAIGKPGEEIPQAFTPYKEVLDVYDEGLELPDDVTIIWPDDNYGYMKRLSSPKEQKRSGRSGVYYHSSYLGKPHDHLWMNTVSPTLMYEELRKAYDATADRIWLLNAGDIKSCEFAVDYFLTMAFDIDAFNFERAANYRTEWLCGMLGDQYRNEYQDVVNSFYKLAFARKPEFMGWGYQWTTDKHGRERNTDTDFSLTNYREVDNRLSEYRRIGGIVENILNNMSDEKQKACFYQSLYYPVKGCELLNRMVLDGQRNRWYAIQQRASAKDLKKSAKACYDSLEVITKGYNSLLDGKWNHVMTMKQGFAAAYFELPKYYTFEEYKTLIKDSQTDKDGNLIYLYANNKDEQYSYIEAAKNKGYNVLLMGGQLDVAMVSMLEQKFEKVRFTRVDSDVVDNLIVKEDKAKDVLEADKQEVLSVIFKSQLPQIEKTEFNVMAQALGENASPVMITQSEYMRRMKEMANIQAGMSFYGEMPDMFNLVLNADHKLVKEILADEDKECAAAVAPIQKEMDDVNTRRNELKKKQEGKKDEDIPTAEKDEVNDLDKKWEDLKNRKNGLFADYAAQNKVVRQLIDLALLQNGMLKGEALNNFVKRSIDLIK